MSLQSHRPALFLFFFVFLFSGVSRVATSFDSRWTVYTAMNIWQHGRTDLDNYPDQLRANDDYAIEHINGHSYSRYPVGVAVLSMPLIVAEVEILRGAQPLLARVHAGSPVINAYLHADWDTAHPLFEEHAASFLLACSTMMIFVISRRYLATGRAGLLALLFALATPAYSVAGRALWQHTWSLLFLTVIIYLLLAAEERPSMAIWAGLPVALSYTVRPTNALFVVVFTAYVAMRYRRQLFGYLAAAAPVAIVFLAYNYSVYHAPLSPYYSQSPPASLSIAYFKGVAEALIGNLISPSRGLFVYTPVFLFSIFSFARQDWIRGGLPKWLAALVPVQWFLISLFTAQWWAGQCYGSRFFTDLTAIFVLALIPFMARWGTLKPLVRVAFVALALVSLGMNQIGGWSGAAIDWNVTPVSVDVQPSRNWDWSDPPFLRAFRPAP